MSTVKVHAGDFYKSNGVYYQSTFVLKNDAHWIIGEQIPITEIELLEEASEESVARIGSAVGWGIATTVLFGPVGILVGLLAAIRKEKRVTFVALFKDGRKLLATTDSKAFNDMRSRLCSEKRDAAWDALSNIGR